MNFKQSFLFTSLAIVLFGIAFLSGYLIHTFQSSPGASFPILAEAYQILVSQGLKAAPDAPALEYGMIRGMLQSYDDPYTLFVEPVQHELESNSLQGSFGGIGVNLERDAEGNVLLYPFPDSPAVKAGVLDGDRLVAIEDLPVSPQTRTETIQASIRGPIGDRVRLTIARPPDFALLEITLKRAEIALPSVIWHLAPAEPRLGVIQINLIAASTPAEIKRSVQDLRRRGATHFVLDLRDNPGGLLEAGVDVARLFLKDGVVIEQQYRGRDVESFRVERAGELADLPLAVLINHGSASAAEIIAGSLQAHDRALLIGSPSFGKDTIQLVFDLEDGSSLHVTAAHWWVPGLKTPLGGSGLQPNILVEPAADESDTLDTAVQAAAQAFFGSN